MDGSQQSGQVLRQPVTAHTDRMVKSAHRVLQVFELFSQRGVPINATEISQSLGFPQSSTAMLLKSLVTLGYLDFRQESRTFRPTIRLPLLGGWAPDQLSVADDILLQLRRLKETTGSTIILSTQQGTHLRYLSVLVGEGQERSIVQAGALGCLTSDAMGYALLALKSESEVRAIVRRVNSDERIGGDRVALTALLETLDQTRCAGFASSEHSGQAPAASMIAAAFATGPDCAPLCIGVLASTSRFRANEALLVRSLGGIRGLIRPVRSPASP